MNKLRRKSLSDLVYQIECIKLSIELTLEDEEEYRDNIPENLQGSERYEKADIACSSLEDAISCLEDAINNIQTAIE